MVGLVEWRMVESGATAAWRAADLGADGLQLDLGGPGRGEWIDAPGRIEALRAVAGATGAALLAVAANHLNDVGLTAPADTPDAARVSRLIERALDAACKLGAPLVIIPSFRRSVIDSPAALTRTAQVLGWAAREAHARGLRVASENVIPVPQAKHLVEQVSSSAFRLIVDTYNPVAAGLAPDTLIAGLAPWVGDQIHLKDGPPAVGETPPLGCGAAGVDTTLAALRRHEVPVAALVLENDYRDGDATRLAADLAWARRQARQFDPVPDAGNRG